MARLFTYGKLKRAATIPGLHLPGTYTSAQGVQFGTSAIVDEAVDVEFGEVVAITGETDKGLKVKRATSTLLASLATAGVVVKDVIGQREIKAGFVNGAKAGAVVPITVVPLSAPKGWEIVIPVGEAVAAGDPVFIGNGSKTSAKAGAGYKEQKDTTGCLELTGYVYATASYKPTTSDSLCAVIKKA